MAKADYAKDIEIQRLLKENSSLKNRLQTSGERELSLKDKIQHLENSFNNSGSPKPIFSIAPAEIKLTTNIRDEYQYEEIEGLAQDILNNGQLQPALISKDNFLLAGYRRYHAIKFLNENQELFPQAINKIPAFLVVYKLELNAEDLTRDKIETIQLSENGQRRPIDNFQLSRLFNIYAEKGFDQAYISDKFKKSKTLISAIMSLKNIDPPLVNFLKEFQVFGWSRKKFTAVNLQSVTETDKAFLEKNKGIIGWKPLYEIAKQPDITSQKKVFMKLYRNRLSPEELESGYFKAALKQELNKDEKKIKLVFKSAKSFSNAVKRAGYGLPADLVKQLNKNLNQIEALLEKIK
jgi:hypothetical protein